MMVCEEDKQAVGFTDMRQYQVWLRESSLVIRLLALAYPPGVYRLTLLSGEMIRVTPVQYEIGASGLAMSVLAVPALNPELPYLIPHKITGVDPSKLVAIKWPPDARVH